MAKNFVQPGHVTTHVAGAGGVKSGDFVIVGAMFGVAAISAAEDEEYELTHGGVWTLPKANGALADGAAVYWSTANSNLTTTASGNTKVGVALGAADAAATEAVVRLNDNF